MNTKIQNFLIDLAGTIRRTVLPHVGTLFSRGIEGVAKSGDTTFSLDTVAEKALEDFIKQSDIHCSYYSEDRGLIHLHSNPEYLLIVDPVDGTRPAACNLDLASVCISLVKYGQEPIQREVIAGIVQELFSGKIHYAEKGKGALIIDGDKHTIPTPSKNEYPERMFWAFEVAGRPSEPLIKILAPLVDASSILAGIFIFNSSAFAVTRVACGNLDAFVDIAGRILHDFPETKEQFLKAGRREIVGLFPYDVSAAVLIAQEAGCTVSDAYGNSLDPKSLIASSAEGILSCIVAGNEVLHKKILKIIEESFKIAISH